MFHIRCTAIGGIRTRSTRVAQRGEDDRQWNNGRRSTRPIAELGASHSRMVMYYARLRSFLCTRVVESSVRLISLSLPSPLGRPFTHGRFTHNPPRPTPHTPSPASTSQTSQTNSHNNHSATATNVSRTLLLIDASGIIFRQYFGMKKRTEPVQARVEIPPIQSEKDTNAHTNTTATATTATNATPSPASFDTAPFIERDVSALYGYVSSILNLCFHLRPTHVAACMDLGRTSFRHQIFPG